MRSLRIAVSLVPVLILAGALSARAEDTSPPEITHTPITSAKKGASVDVRARITDQSKFFPQVFYKWDGGAFAKPIDMKPMKGKKNKNMFEALIPAKGETTLEYYIEAYDEFGNGPARSGSPESPNKVEVEQPKVAAAPADDAPPVVEAQKSAEPPATAQKTEEAPPPVAEEPKKDEPPAVAGRNNKAPDESTAPPRAATASGGKGRTWTWIVGGTGLGLLAGGALTGLAFKKADDAYNARLADPAGNNPSTLKQQYDANKTLGTMSTVALVGGGVLLAGGVALYFLEAPSKSGSDRADNAGPAQDRRLSFAAAPLQNGAAAVVAGRF